MVLTSYILGYNVTVNHSIAYALIVIEWLPASGKRGSSLTHYEGVIF